MTLGKFYVPFGVQEWEYESKYGAMFQIAHGATSFTGSVNYNFNRNSPNIYLRIGRQFTPRTSAGVSTGGGRGVFSDSSHALAFGIDLAHDFGGVQFSAEYDFADGASGSFQYVSGKLTFTKAGRFIPYLGVKLAMDDFGTGYSCMANMTSFPLDTIKSDRAFIQRLSNDEANSKHMVEAIIALSKALLLDVTGEGVETLQQVLYLKSLGCDIVQGYYFAEPLTPDDMVSFLAGGRGSLAESCDIPGQQPPKLIMLVA